MGSKSYLTGPKLGDCINSLMVCKRNYEIFGFKAKIFLSNIGCSFEKGLDFTYNELYPILEKQEWFDSFELYENQNIDINLLLFRNSNLLYRDNWLNIFLKTFLDEKKIPKDYKWIEISEKDDSLKDVLLINRSVRMLLSEKSSKKYEELIKNNENAKFICFDEEQYNNFKFKNKIKMLKVSSLYDFFIKINSCKLFLGNQSSPTTIASSLNIPRIVELCDEGFDSIHYRLDSLYYSNFSCF
jgi:hypothetical protein